MKSSHGCLKSRRETPIKKWRLPIFAPAVPGLHTAPKSPAAPQSLVVPKSHYRGSRALYGFDSPASLYARRIKSKIFLPKITKQHKKACNCDKSVLVYLRWKVIVPSKTQRVSDAARSRSDEWELPLFFLQICKILCNFRNCVLFL